MGSGERAETMKAQVVGGAAPRAHEQGLFHSLAYVLGSTAAIRAGGFFYTILIRRILDPRAIGVWNLSEIVIAYLSAATIGIGYSSERLIPHFRGRNDLQAEAAVRDSLFTWTVIESVVLGALVYVYLAVRGDGLSADVRLALCWVPLLFVTHRLVSVYVSILRSTKAFRAYSLGNTLAAFLDWSLLAFAYLWGLPGLLVGAAVVGVAKVACLHRLQGPSRLFSFHWRSGADALRLHMPYAVRYSVFKLAWTVGERLDSLVVAWALGASALGYYYLGFQLQKVALEIPIALVYIAFPNMMEKFGTVRNGAFSREFFRYLRVQLFLILPVVLPLAYFGSDLLVRHALPGFLPGLVAAKITLLALSLLAVRYLYYQVLMAHERVGTLFLVTAVQLPMFLVLVLLFRGRFADPLSAVAVANLLAHAVHLACVVWATIPLLGRDTQGLFRKATFDLLAPAAWIALLFAVDALAPLDPGGSLLRDMAACGTRILAFALLAGPLSYVGLGQERVALARRLYRVAR